MEINSLLSKYFDCKSKKIIFAEGEGTTYGEPKKLP
jgi:hypothetical protein